MSQVHAGSARESVAPAAGISCGLIPDQKLWIDVFLISAPNSEFMVCYRRAVPPLSEALKVTPHCAHSIKPSFTYITR